jgi:transposase
VAVTSLSPGSGEKLSKHALKAGDAPGLLARLEELWRKALARTGTLPPIAAVLWTEGLCHTFANRRQAGAYGGLAPTPWRSGANRP